MCKVFFKDKELVSKGFEMVNDGGEFYYQKILFPENFFESPYLASETLESTSDGEVRVQLNGKGDFLTEQEIDNLK